jgi:hypothetical protein
MSLRYDEHQLIHFPTCIESEKYPRNKLIFSVGVVISRDLETGPYENVVRKMAQYLRACEVQDELVSDLSKFSAFRPQFRYIWRRLTTGITSQYTK